MPSPRSRDAAFSVLFVCTGNICRSPLAERLARAYLQDVLGDTSDQMRLLSAGVQAVVGSGMHAHSALVLEGLGGDPVGFQARQLTDRLVAEADVVLTMTRSHQDEVLRLAPRALSRTFTLREAADLVDLLGDGHLRGRGPAERARSLVECLATVRSRRRSRDGDIVDPISSPIAVHQEVGDTIAGALIPILKRIASPEQRRPIGAGDTRPDTVHRSPSG